MDEMMTAIRKQFGYMLSLPERTLRSLAAVASGTTSLLGETLVPSTLRDSNFYKVLIGDMQRFLARNIAQMPPEPGQEATEDSAQRKVMGSALETAGLLAMHVSPLWIFALAGDAAAGSSVFLNRLVDELKKNKVIEPETQVTGLTDLLGAVQESSRRNTAAVATPPLSREQLSKLANDMTASYKQMFAKARDLMPRLDDLWKKLTGLATRENISLEKLSGILAVDVAETGKKGANAVLAFGQTSADLIGETILTSYAHTLDAVTSQGVSNYVSAQLKPFLDTAIAHFDPNRSTWTEKQLGLSGDISEVAAAQAGADDDKTETFPPPPPFISGETAHPFPPHPPHDDPTKPTTGNI